MNTDVAPQPSTGRGTSIWRMLWRDKRAVFAFIVLALTVAAACASFLVQDAATHPDTTKLLASPSWAHPFGTDELGRDTLARVVQGSMVTVQVLVVAIGAALVIGTTVGLISGYVGGVVDSIVMRIVDSLLAFPLLVLALTIVAALGPGTRNALIAIALVVTPRIARVVRGEVLSLRTREWVAAARISGVPTRIILGRHLLPHLTGTLMVFTALQASTAILAESALSFLGLGVQPPQASWGALVASGSDHLERSWALGVFPGLAILTVICALNLLSDSVADAVGRRRDTERR